MSGYTTKKTCWAKYTFATLNNGSVYIETICAEIQLYSRCWRRPEQSLEKLLVTIGMDL